MQKVRNMTIFRYTIAVILSCAFSSTAFSAECRVNGTVTEVAPYTYDIRTTIRATNDGKKIILDGYNLECRFYGSGSTPVSHVDYWETLSPGINFNPKLSSYGGGLNINGGEYTAPVANGIRIADMPWAGGGPWVPLSIYPYVSLGNNPVNPINIMAGEQVAEIRLTQFNNYSGVRVTFYYRLLSSNNFSVQPSTCSVNNDQPIEIDFGSINSQSIGESVSTTSQRVNTYISIQCPNPGITRPVTVTLTGGAASFDSSVLRMSNNDLGVALIKSGTTIPLNTPYQTTITNSIGGDDVTFALIKKTGTKPAPGLSTGSGVLILGVP